MNLFYNDFSRYFFSLSRLLFITLLLASCGDRDGSESSSSSGSSTSSSTSSSSTSSSSSSSSSSSGASTAYQNGDFVLGMDISYWSEQLDRGSVYVDTDGQEKDLLVLLKNHGINVIRLRTFVDPSAEYGYASGAGGTSAGCSQKAKAYNGIEDTIAMAKRIKGAGMGLMLDFHYSDTWADPGKQVIPSAWLSARSIDELAGHVNRYTKEVLTRLKDEDALPDMVQVGNEATPGILIHAPTSNSDCWGNNGRENAINGRSDNWSNLGKLLQAGVSAVNEVEPDILTVLHIENFDHPDGIEWWVNSALGSGVQFDVLALSAYEEFQGPVSNWRSTMQRLAGTFPDLSFTIAEYNPHAGLLADIMREVPGGRGIGTFFWEPTESGFWGNAIFSRQGNSYRANADDFAEYDKIVEDYGLKKLQ